MKVLHVVSGGLGNETGGIRPAIQGMVRSLLDAGMRVTLATPPSKYYCSAGDVRNLFQLLSEADVVHLHDLWLIPEVVVALLAKRNGTPYVVTPHGELDPWALRHHWLRKYLHRLVFRDSILRYASAVHAVSAAEAIAVRRSVRGCPVFTIPCGVDLEEFSNLPSPYTFRLRYPQLIGHRIVLFLGRVHLKKGLQLLAPAFAKLHKLMPDTALVIAGPFEEPGYKRVLEANFASEGIAETVLFTGLLTGKDRLAALAAADLFVLPSHSEGLPIALLEAMACNLPVVATEQCNMPEIAESGAGRIVKRTAEDLVHAIIDLLQDEATRIQCGANGRRLVEQCYQWDAIASELARMYRTAVQGTVPGSRSVRE